MKVLGMTIPISGCNCFELHSTGVELIIHRLYNATLLKDPAALYDKGDINIKPIK